MDQVIIRDLLTRGVIGISERERAQPQDILINAILFTDTRPAATSDRIEDCVDYSKMAKQIFQFVAGASRYTVEALAADLAALCLQDPRVTRVQIRIEKPGAVRFAKSVGVEIERARG